MTDRPPQHNEMPDEPEFTGGWRPPQTPGAWRPVKREEEPRPVWRQPALPPNLQPTPSAEGDWHLPRPEDTIFTPESVIEVQETPPAPEAQEAVSPVEERPDELALIEAARGGTAAPVPEADGEPAEDDLLLDDDSLSDSQSLLELEESASQEIEPVDVDDDVFSMSELMALASLVEQPAKAQIVPGISPAPSAPQPDDEATEAVESVEVGEAGDEDDSDLSPAEYARRQVERMSRTGPQPAADSLSDTGAQVAAGGAAAYARQRLEDMGITGGAAATPLTPEERELSRRFRETQEKVRLLRNQYREGELTRDQLQAQLRQLMILDNNRTWWMMGVETDHWYRFDNGEWVMDAPPVPLTGGVQAGFTPAPGMAFLGDDADSGSLPRLPTDHHATTGDYTQPSDLFRTPTPLGGFDPDESPLPRTGLPVQDPDRTTVGTAGAYLDPVRGFEADTLPAVDRFAPDTLQGEQYTGIPAPGPEDVHPDYRMEQEAPTYEEIAQRQRQRMATNILRLGLVGLGGVLLLFACGIGLVLVQYYNIANQWQTEIAALANYQPQFQTVRIQDMNGNNIAELTSQQGGARTNVPLDRISPFMIHAVVSVENERFFEDPGWDWIAIFRAFLQNVGGGEVVSGASTITQQIARQLVLKDSTVSPERKLQEIVIASQIAQRYSKNEILELYLNEIYFGNQSYGVEAAAQFYFSHTANDMTLPEAALLAGMIAAPAAYDPVRRGGEDLDSYSRRREITLERMRAVIQQMQQVGCLQFQHAPYLNEPFCINQQVVRQAATQQAIVEAATYLPREVTFRHPHFVQFVQQMVERTYGSGEMYRRGFVIRTTLNPTIQTVAEAALRNRMAQLVNTGINTGSIMVTDPRTGAVRAMVGSPDFNNEDIDGQVNTALTWQQPGSAIKPVVYTAALEGAPDPNTGQLRYLTPASILWDLQTTFNVVPPYTPTNFDGRFRGPVSLRYALQNSINVPAVRAYDFIGGARFRETAERMGLRFPEETPFGLATALGAAEVTLYDMMVAYGTLANNGTRTPLYVIESITDANNLPVTLPDRPQPVQAVQPQVAFLMQSILSDDTARADQFGAGGPMTIEGLPRSNYVAAKTGTTDGNRDLWTMGFTRNAVVGVWLGRPDNARTFVQGGGYSAVAPLWNEVMRATLRTMTAPQPFTNPGGVVETQICPQTGTLPSPNCPALRTELFLANQLPPPAEQAFVQQVAVDTWTGLRANQYCPDNQISGIFVNVTEPVIVNWLNSSAGVAYLRQLGLQGGALQAVPPAACDLNTEIPIARITFPSDGQPVSGSVQVTGSASSSKFNRYQLEAAPAGSTNYTIVSGPATTPQTSGVLGTWDTTALPNGQYTLRLAMFATDGGYLYRTVTVAVNNVQPTATPTTFIPVVPTQPPVETLPPEFTPLPFEEVLPP